VAQQWLVRAAEVGTLPSASLWMAMLHRIEQCARCRTKTLTASAACSRKSALPDFLPGHQKERSRRHGTCEFISQHQPAPISGSFAFSALAALGSYGELAGGAHSPRWQNQFEEMYPADVFACPAYAILGITTTSDTPFLLRVLRNTNPKCNPSSYYMETCKNDRTYLSKWPFWRNLRI
jgi:hypothetical protein